VNGAAWRRVAEGVQLVGFGVFLLLTTQGLLPWSFWTEAISFWPVLLVGFGLRLVFQESRTPWAVLMGPLVVMGVLTWVAAVPRVVSPGAWVSRTLVRPEGTERWTLAAHLAGGRVDLVTAPVAEGLLSEGRSATRGGAGRFELRRSGTEPVVRLDEGRGGPIRLGLHRNQSWDLRLDEKMPVALDFEGVFMSGHSDLRTGRVTEVRVEGVGNDLEVRLPRPEVEVRLRVEGVFNSLRLVVPLKVPVRVHVEGPLNHVERDVTAGVAGEDPGYDVRVSGLMNAVTVDEDKRP
jgi:hypothetical protein